MPKMAQLHQSAEETVAGSPKPRYEARMTTDTIPQDIHALYGHPPTGLAEALPGAVQFSPLVPGAAALEQIQPGTVADALVLAPPGTVERRYALACLLQAARPGAPFTVMAPKAKGGSRIAAELEGFGCETASDSRRHFRIVETRRPDHPAGLAEAIEAGRPRFDEALGFWTQGGVFAADRIDRGSQFLIDHLPALTGSGADLGCGIGVLGRAALQAPKVTRLVSVDLDRRAIEAARRNLDDERAEFRWADARDPLPDLEGLNFVLSNPPFHDGGAEDRSLGQAFVRRAAGLLRKGGSAYIVANRHLPYEAVLAAAFAKVTVLAEAGGYKLFEARR